MLVKIGMVGETEVRDAIGKWLVPLFKAETSNLVVTCAKDMAGKMVDRFAAEGWKIQSKGLDEFEDDYGLEEVDGDSEEDDERMSIHTLIFPTHNSSLAPESPARRQQHQHEPLTCSSRLVAQQAVELTVPARLFRHVPD
jgi:hypothetical protein